MTRVDVVTARLRREEGRRPLPYNDATGHTVTCRPNGNLTVGYGCDLEFGLDDEEMEWLLAHRVAKADAVLVAYTWYPPLDEPRASVLLDLAYNEGAHFLLHFPKMLAALAVGAWKTAADELLDSDSARELPTRYGPLAQILLTGRLQ